MTEFDSHALRDAFGSFMTGVTVVTALRADGVPVGFTANSFSSVSMDPPMLLICPGKFLSSYETFANCSHFVVNILSEGQEAISNIFASFKGDRFAQVPHRLDANGVPLIDGATAQFSCSTHQIIAAGDHCILVGKISAITHTDYAGLGYVGGQYFSLGLERAAFDEPIGLAVCGAIIEDGEQVILVQTSAGLRPPQCMHADSGNLISELENSLAGKGIAAEFGQTYSVFEDKKTREHNTYFLATGQLIKPSTNIVAVPISELAQRQYTTPAIARMMARFALESRTRGFALYLGDTERGAIHNKRERK